MKVRSKLAVVAAGALAPLALMVPANAVSNDATCQYDTSNPNKVAGSLSVTYVSGDIDRLNAVGKIYNDGANRTWNWTMFHNGSVSAQGTVTGGSTITRTMLNFAGTDTVRFSFDNAAGTVHCDATVNF